MLPYERAKTIMTQLSQHRVMSVTDLCQITGASEATIRRDLNILARQGRLVRVRGGATSQEERFLAQEPEFSAEKYYVKEKERIARYAARLVGMDNVVYLDTGTTMLPLADYLKNSKAIFVTSGIEVARRLSAYGRRVHVLGGTLKPWTVDIVGTEAQKALRRYHFTMAFLAASGVSISRGFTTPDPDAAVLKALAASQAHTVYMLADSSIFGRASAATILPLGGAKIITDNLPDQGYLDCTEVIVV